MPNDETKYEKETRKKFWFGPLAYLGWRDFHRGTLAQLLADPRVAASPGAQQAIREML